MKVLITGKNGKLVSYLKGYLAVNHKELTVDFVSLRNDEWKNTDFSIYDSVIHCANLTTVPNDNYDIFFKINVDLTKELFEMVTQKKVKQFIYLSSMAIYDGIGWGFGNDGYITIDTVPNPKSNYGKSKYLAEKVIKSMDNKDTLVAIVRSPSIIGGGIEEYFNKYIKFSKIPFISVPWVHPEAKRSFVYIDTLIELLIEIVVARKEGTFFPQNFPQLSAAEILFEVCRIMGKPKKIGKWGKLLPQSIKRRYFSQVCYDKNLSDETVLTSISSREAISKVVRKK